MPVALIILAAVLPALGLLYFIYRKDDLRKEPKDQILRAFGLGAMAAPASMLVSIPLLLLGVYATENITVGDAFRSAFFGAAIPEELAKLALLWLFLRRNTYFDEWVDGIVYAACVGLGFAALENIMYLFQNLDNLMLIGSVRAILSVPAHFFFAVSMGYFMSLAYFGDKSRRKLYSALALIVPVLFHGLFDWILMSASLAGSGAASAITFFAALYVFLAVRSRKLYREHHRRDEMGL